MTDDELMRERVNCNPQHVCSTIDKLRRKIVAYGRHFRTEEAEDETLVC
jgi:hypothetical protein